MAAQNGGIKKMLSELAFGINVVGKYVNEGQGRG